MSLRGCARGLALGHGLAGVSIAPSPWPRLSHTGQAFRSRLKLLYSQTAPDITPALA
jgi:hypothetical protein